MVNDDIKVDMSNLLPNKWNTFFVNNIKKQLKLNKISLKEFGLIEYFITNYPNLFYDFDVYLYLNDKINIFIGSCGENKVHYDLIKFLNREFEEFEDLITFELG